MQELFRIIAALVAAFGLFLFVGFAPALAQDCTNGDTMRTVDCMIQQDQQMEQQREIDDLRLDQELSGPEWHSHYEPMPFPQYDSDGSEGQDSRAEQQCIESGECR